MSQPLNRLLKTLSGTWSNGQQGQPARPYVPARPAWIEYVLVRSNCRMEPRATTIKETIRVPVYRLDTWEIERYIDKVVERLEISQAWVCDEQLQQVFHPAQPAVPAQPPVADVPGYMNLEFHLGWNAGARSIARLADDGWVQFQIPRSVGAIVGLAADPAGVSPSTIEHAFYAYGASLAIWERGAIAHALGAYQHDDVLRIHRAYGQVIYTVNGKQVYTSQQASEGAVYLDASLYSAMDEVHNPAIQSAALARLAGVARPAAGMLLQGYDSYFSGKSRPATGALSQKRLIALQLVSREATGRITHQMGSSIVGVSRAGRGWIETGPPYALFAGKAQPASGFLQVQESPFLRIHGASALATAAWTDYDYAWIRADTKPAYGRWSALAAQKTQIRRTLSMPHLTLVAGCAMVRNLAGPVLRLESDSTATAVSLPLPAATARMVGGATVVRKLPRVKVQVQASVAHVARVTLRAAAAQVQMLATVTQMAGAALKAPAAAVRVAGGASARHKLPAAHARLQASVQGQARVAMVLPAAQVQLQATGEAVGRITLLIPQPHPLAWSRAVLTLPVPRLWLQQDDGAAVEPDPGADPSPAFGVAINLRSDLEGGGNEVTQLAGMGFTSYVRWQGKHYAVNRQGLHTLGGPHDDGQPIAWTVQTGMTDFGVPQKKTPFSCYLGGRLGAVSQFKVFAGEQYTTPHVSVTPRGEAAQNYRQRFGMGLNERYYAFGLAGEGELVVDVLEFDVRVSKRRI